MTAGGCSVGREIGPFDRLIAGLMWVCVGAGGACVEKESGRPDGVSSVGASRDRLEDRWGDPFLSS